jgi:hypothetical protein
MAANAKNKHKAIIVLKVTVHEILESGEFDAHLVSQEDLAKYDIKSKAVITVEGYDKNNCLKRLKDKLNDLKS